MEVVIDVNVFVSATLSGAGPSAQLVAAIRDRRLTAVACDKLLVELGGVLRRDRFRRYIWLEEVDDYLVEIEMLCGMVGDPDPVPQVLRDGEEMPVDVQRRLGRGVAQAGLDDLHRCPAADQGAGVVVAQIVVVPTSA